MSLINNIFIDVIAKLHLLVLKFIDIFQERKNIERILPVQRKQIENLIDGKNDAIEQLNTGQITSKSPELLSLSIISIS